jgi:hypothetical protein
MYRPLEVLRRNVAGEVYAQYIQQTLNDNLVLGAEVCKEVLKHQCAFGDYAFPPQSVAERRLDVVRHHDVQ